MMCYFELRFHCLRLRKSFSTLTVWTSWLKATSEKGPHLSCVVFTVTGHSESSQNLDVLVQVVLEEEYGTPNHKCMLFMQKPFQVEHTQSFTSYEPESPHSRDQSLKIKSNSFPGQGTKARWMRWESLSGMGHALKCRKTK